MKLLIFLSLFFYQTLHANILYPLPTHKFDFSTSAYNYNSSNLSKKRALASVITKAKTFFNKLSDLDSEPLNSQEDKDVYLYEQVGKKDLEGVKNALKIGADSTYIELDYFFKDITKLTETEQKIIEIIKEAQRIYHLKDQLNYGVRYTNLDKVIESLEKGADPNHRLHLNLPHLLQLALRYRALIQKLPLTEQHEKIVEALLKHGADPNLYSNDLPPLHLAVLLRSPKIVKLLVKHGAKVDFKHRKDVTPLLLVVDLLEAEKNFERYIGELNKNEIDLRSQEDSKLDIEITQALLDAGADINEKTLGGNTLLVNAAIEGHLEFALFLIEKGANLEEAIEIIKKRQDLLKNKNIYLEFLNRDKTFVKVERAFQLDRNNSVLEFLEKIKTLRQNFKKQLGEIKLHENDKASCQGAFGA